MTFEHLRSIQFIRYVSLALVFCFSAAANAQFLTIVDNNFTVSVPSSTFNQIVNIQDNASVPLVDAIPLTGTLTTPTLSFTLSQDGAESKTGTYAIGIVLIEQVSARRLEIYIPGVDFAYDAGGNLSVTLTNGMVNAYGRNDTGTSEASASVTSAGSVTSSGNTISFSTASQVTAIQGLGGAFGAIVNPITNTGLTYSYNLILKHTGGDFFDFRYSSAGSPAALPNAASNELVLSGASADSAVLSGGQKLTGTLTYGTSSGGGGGGGSGLPSCVGDQILLDAACVAGTTTINSILSGVSIPTQNVTQQDVGEIESALADFNTLVSDNIQGIEEGKVSIDNALTLADGVTDALDLLGQATQGGGTTNISSASSAITNLMSIFSAIESTNTNLSVQQQTEISTQCAEAFSATAQSIVTETTLSQVSELMDSSTSLLNLTASLSNGVNSELLSGTQTLVQAALETTLQEIALSIGANVLGTNSSDIQAVQNALNSDAALKSAVINELGVNVESSATLNTTALETELVSSGLTSGAASNIAGDLALFKNSSGILVGINTAEDRLRSTISSLGTSTLVMTDSDTNLTTLTVDGSKFPVYVSSSRIVPESIPEGISTTPDGNVISVDSGVATVIVPAIANSTDFSAAIASAGASLRIESNGIIEIQGSDFAFTGKFAFEDIGTDNGQSGEISISQPQGNPADVSYVFLLNYPNGTSQRILPAVSSNVFFQALTALGSSDFADSNTGVVSIQGKPYRPSYFSTTPTTAEITFLNSNMDATGTAFQASGDLNNDGIDDIVAITGSVSQVLYGL